MVEKFDFNDILIEPEILSDINSRSEINPFDKYQALPIFVSPMDTVVDMGNVSKYLDNMLHICYPRTAGFPKVMGDFYTSYSLNEIKEIIDKDYRNRLANYILIDIANGHMKDLYETIKTLKQYAPSVTLMVGNVANPITYRELSKIGADYIRVGIGNGNGCFLEGSMVISKNGIKPIEDVVIGDLVLTHTGEYKTVESIIGYPTREELIEINGITCTLNHEIYVLNEKYSKLVTDENLHEYAEWIEAKDLTDKYFLLENVNNV